MEEMIESHEVDANTQALHTSFGLGKKVDFGLWYFVYLLYLDPDTFNIKPYSRHS